MIHVSDFITNTADLTLLGLADDLRDEWEHKTNWDERNRLLDRVFAFSAHDGPPRDLPERGRPHRRRLPAVRQQAHPDAQRLPAHLERITYAKAPGKLLKLVVRERGELGDQKKIEKEDRTSFVRLHVFEENNFGLVHACVNDGQTLELSWDLYGSTGQEGEVVRLKRVGLPVK